MLRRKNDGGKGREKIYLGKRFNSSNLFRKYLAVYIDGLKCCSFKWRPTETSKVQRLEVSMTIRIIKGETSTKKLDLELMATSRNSSSKSWAHITWLSPTLNLSSTSETVNAISNQVHINGF
jgi:hypothetical protein